MFGIGLGGFAQGLQEGFGIGERAQEGRYRRKERKRLEENREQLEAIDTEAKSAYEAKGGAMGGGGDWDTFYTNYAVPKKVATLLEQGDLAGASAFQEWGEGAAAKKGSKLFAAGMMKGQAGDMKGAISDFIQAGKVKGYGDDYEIGDPVELDGGGWRVTVKGADGQEHQLDFATPDEVLQFGATYLNPEKAFEDWQAGQKSAAEREAKITDSLAIEEGKSQIGTRTKLTEKELGLGNEKEQKDQTIAARKQALDELKDSDTFFAATPDEQAKMIDERARAILGQTGQAPAGASPEAPGITQPATGGAPTGRVIVDTVTGEQVRAPRVAVGGAPGSGGSRGRVRTRPPEQPSIVTPEGIIVDAQSGEPTGRASPAETATVEAPGIAPPAGGAQAAEMPDVSQIVAEARNRLKGGAAPNTIRFWLRRQGVPLDQWPEELKPQ